MKHALHTLLQWFLERLEPDPLDEFPPEAHVALHITDPSGTTKHIHCSFCRAFIPAETYEAHLETCADAFLARVNKALPTLPDKPREDVFAAFVGTLDMTPLDSADNTHVDIQGYDDDALSGEYGEPF